MPYHERMARKIAHSHVFFRLVSVSLGVSEKSPTMTKARGQKNLKKGETKMIEMTVKFSKEKVSYKDKETGKEKQFDKIMMELPNGKKMEMKSG